MAIEYKKITTISEVEKNQLLKLYCLAEWVEYSNDTTAGDFLFEVVSKSNTFVVAISEYKEIIGCARAISDGCSDAYIQDVVVDPKFRKQGIGRALTFKVISLLKEQNIDWIGIVGAPGTETFYANMGLKKAPNHTLWNA